MELRNWLMIDGTLAQCLRSPVGAARGEMLPEGLPPSERATRGRWTLSRYALILDASPNNMRSAP